MQDDDFTETQKEKVQMLDEYRDDIDELLDAAESLRKRSEENWPELFLEQVDDEIWTDEWHYPYEDYREWGRLFKEGWWLDENHEPTTKAEEAWGDNAFRLHFVHWIREKESFAQGVLRLSLYSTTTGEMRDEFHRLYNSSKWQDELRPLLDELNITNRGIKKKYMEKTYDVDQSRLPESYFRTLAKALEEHLPVVEVVDEILEETLENIEASD